MVDRAPKATAGEALAIARLWDGGAIRAVHVRNGENATWQVERSGRPWILRLTSERHRTRDQLEAELDFVEHVAAGGLRAAAPARTPAGERIVDVSQQLAAGERTFATVFTRFEGRPFEYHSSDLARPLFLLWGETMARLHELSRSFEARPGARRPDWPDDSVAGCRVDGLVCDEATLDLRGQLVARLHAWSPTPAHYGMVHGDFERTNFLLDGDGLALFDFDDCCRHWFVWDIACALWVFRNASPDERARFLGWLLEGYTDVREADAERLASFSEWIRLRSVALLLRRLRLASSDDRDWLERERRWLLSPWRW